MAVEQLGRRRLGLGLEPRSPVAECLERNPLRLAILSLIQLTLLPGHHDAPTKKPHRNVLELTTSRPPTCKIDGENRSRP
jgi:hypothetical protein